MFPYTEEELQNLRQKAELEKRPFLYREHRPEKFETWDGTKTIINNLLVPLEVRRICVL